MSKKIVMGIVSLTLAFGLSACGNNSNEVKPDKSADMNSNSEKSMDIDHSAMEHSSTGEVPEGLKLAENPTYKVGSKVLLQTDHNNELSLLQKKPTSYPKR